MGIKTPLVPALWRRREEKLCEFGAKLVYIVNSRITGTTERSCLQKKKEKENKLPSFSVTLDTWFYY